MRVVVEKAVPALAGNSTLGGGGSNIFGGILSVLGVVLVLIVVLFIAYQATKFIGKRQFSSSFRGGYIEVIEHTALGRDRSLYIIRVKDEVFLLGVTAQQVDLIKQLNAEDYPEPPDLKTEPKSFSSLLKDSFSKTVGIKNKDKKDNAEDE